MITSGFTKNIIKIKNYSFELINKNGKKIKKFKNSKNFDLIGAKTKKIPFSITLKQLDISTDHIIR